MTLILCALPIPLEGVVAAQTTQPIGLPDLLFGDLMLPFLGLFFGPLSFLGYFAGGSLSLALAPLWDAGFPLSFFYFV